MFFGISLKILQYSQENNWFELIVNRVAGLNTPEAPKQAFLCEYCQSFKNSFFYGTSTVAASDTIATTKQGTI